MIHDTAIVHGNTTIHPTAEVGPYCVLGSDHGHLWIREGSIIRSHTMIEGGSTIGAGLETGHHALIRTNSEIGLNLRLGTQSRLEGGGKVGDYVRIHGNCEMTLGELHHFTHVYSNCVVADAMLPPGGAAVAAVMDEGAVLCLNSVLLPGVRMGVGSFAAAMTCVTKDIPDGMALVNGRLKPVARLTWQGYTYPWTSYHRGAYPPEARSRIGRLNERILAAVEAVLDREADMIGVV